MITVGEIIITCSITDMIEFKISILPLLTEIANSILNVSWALVYLMIPENDFTFTNTILLITVVISKLLKNSE